MGRRRFSLPRVSSSSSGTGSLLRNSRVAGSAEREGKSLDARIEKLDLEKSIRDGGRLSDELVQPRLVESAVALRVRVHSVGGARRMSIDEHAKSHGRRFRGRCHDEIEIARMEAVSD